MASEWIGDKTDGIEIRRAADGIDEVLLYVAEGETAMDQVPR